MLNSQGAASPESWGGSATFSSRGVRRSPHCARRLSLKTITGTRLCRAAGSAARPAHRRQICAAPSAAAALEASQSSQPRHTSAQAPQALWLTRFTAAAAEQSHSCLSCSTGMSRSCQSLRHRDIRLSWQPRNSWRYRSSKVHG